MARPKKKLNAEEIEALGAIGCTNEEVALVLGVSKDTIERRFAAAIKKGRIKDYISYSRKLRSRGFDDDAKDRLGHMALYGKVRGYYVEKIEHKGQVSQTDPIKEHLLNELLGAKACLEDRKKL
jgi:predicted DNA-binding protein (UPF0251 family)